MARSYDRIADAVVCLGIETEIQSATECNAFGFERATGCSYFICRVLRNGTFQYDNITSSKPHSAIKSIMDATSKLGDVVIYSFKSPVILQSLDFVDLLEGDVISIDESNLHGQEGIVDNDCQLSTLCFTASAPPTIVRFINNESGCVYTLLDVSNYGIEDEYELYELARAVNGGIEKVIGHIAIGGMTSWQVAILVRHFVQQYYHACRSNGLGTPRYTYSAQSAATYYNVTRKIKHEPIVSSAINEQIAKAYYAGRVEPFGNGLYNNPVYHYDFSGMYANIALNNRLPYKQCTLGLQFDELMGESALQRKYVIAEVLLHTDRNRYPYRKGDGIIYPVGMYKTWISGPELVDAWYSGEVRKVFEYYAFDCDFILKPYAERMLQARKECKVLGDKLNEIIIKRITNGLWGKWGEKDVKWIVDNSAVSPIPYGVYWLIKPGENNKQMYRSINWAVCRRESFGWKKTSFLPLSIAINSYGREMLWKAMTHAGLDNVLYVGTDSLIVNAAGNYFLSNLSGNGEFSKFPLALVGSGENLTVKGSGFYTYGNIVKHTGISERPTTNYAGFWSRGYALTDAMLGDGNNAKIAIRNNNKRMVMEAIEEAASTEYSRLHPKFLNCLSGEIDFG